MVASEEGPHRKYYALNQVGRDQLDLSRKVWGEFSAAMNRLLDGVVAA